MAKIAEVREVSLESLRPYERNAKIHGKDQIEKLKDSIREFGFVSPCLIDRENNIIAGHGRVEAARELGMDTVPCVYIEGLTEEQRRAYILADNKLGELADWDMTAVALELGDLSDFYIELTGFEMPSMDSEWFENRERNDRSRQEGNDEYNEFLDKFEEKKTTDDCYTPDNIYEIVANYVSDRYGKNRADYVRPFYPGGDYKKYAYKKTDVVVDNPPFSILAEIIDWYQENGIDYFLFAPGLTVLNYTERDQVTAIVLGVGVTYENGAVVSTCFLTNMDGGETAARTDPELYKRIQEANKENEKSLHKELPKYEYPANVLTAAKMQYLCKYGQTLSVQKKDAKRIGCLDEQKEYGKGIYGGGLLLSETAAAETAAAETAAAETAAAETAAAETAAAETAVVETKQTWHLSDREMEIIKSLGKEGEADV